MSELQPEYTPGVDFAPLRLLLADGADQIEICEQLIRHYESLGYTYPNLAAIDFITNNSGRLPDN
jgi:hypothetical protein